MTFKISASHLKLFLLCPRSWYLKHVLRAPDDQGAGGKYLTRGNDFDRLVQLRVREGVSGDSGAPKLANRQLAEAMRYLPAPKTAEVQFSYAVPWEDFVVVGKPDLRRPGFIQDTKTTSDRGPGRGAAEDRPAYALTDETLRRDEQALLYSWCEFQLDPELAECRCEWIYVSKADCPKAWVARCMVTRAEAEAWFEAVVVPAVAEMRALVERGPEALAVAANPDACRRCFVRNSCPGPFDGTNIYGIVQSTWRRTGFRTRLSTESGPQCAAVAETRETKPSTITADVASPYVNAGSTSSYFSQMSGDDQSLVSQLSESITMATIARKTYGGPHAGKTTSIAGPTDCGRTTPRGTPASIETARGGQYALDTTPGDISEPSEPSNRPLRPREETAMFDLNRLKNTQKSVVEQPATSEPPPPAVAINRPASQRPAPAPTEALTVSTIEGPGAAYLQLEIETTPGVPTTTPAEEKTPAPKARRGRPRKVSATGADTVGASSADAGALDPKAPTTPTTTAPGCAPSVGDLCVAVSALIDAVRALECHGKTGRHLDDAFEAVRRAGDAS